MTVTFNINNPESCQRAYLNYHCYGNTMNISPSDMGAILARWSDKVPTWQKSAEANDSVDYDFDDSDFEKYKEQYKGNGNCVGGEITRGVCDLASAGAGAGQALGWWDMTPKSGKKSTTGKADANANADVNTDANANADVNADVNTDANANADAKADVNADTNADANADAKDSGNTNKTDGSKENSGNKETKSDNETTQETKQSESKDWGCIIACGLAFATGLSYTLKKPNKEEMEVVYELDEKMATSQGELMTQQQEMAETQEEIVTKVAEAETANEEANSFIAEQEADQQFTLATINSIKAKQESGAKLTASERSLYRDSVKLLNESNNLQSTAGAEAQDEVTTLYSDIEGKQSVYDTTADKMSDIQGATEYAESMDTATAVSCGIEAVAQGVNAYSGLKNGAKAMSKAFSSGVFGWMYVAAGVLGLAGGGMSAYGAYEQCKYTVDAIKEIGHRKDTQDLNTSTQEIYNQEVDAFAGSLTYVEDLEYEVPELDDTSGMVLAEDKPTEEPVTKKKTEEK